jgi:hypothetical protein
MRPPAMLRSFITLFFVCLLISVRGAGADSAFIYKIDLANRWIWRGMNYSETPVIQPTFAYKPDKFKFTLWASYGFGREKYEEIDFIADYDLFKGFNIGLIDYFGFRDTIKAPQHFLNFNRRTTGHLLDGQMTYTLQGNIPLTFLWSTWLWGADKNESKEENNYSSYFEISFNKKLHSYQYGFLAGLTPWKGYYNRGFGFINIGAKAGTEFQVTDKMKIPTEMALYLNPQTQNLYLSVMITLTR